MFVSPTDPLLNDHYNIRIIPARKHRTQREQNPGDFPFSFTFSCLCYMDQQSFKIVLLGEGLLHLFIVSTISDEGKGCVGKTSLVLRYCENQFNDKHITTIQASFLRKRLNISNQRVNLAIWVRSRHTKQKIAFLISLCFRTLQDKRDFMH